MTTCHHAHTTTLAWLYGEGSDDHAQHVATCPACLAVTELHADVIAGVAPVLPALRAEPVHRSPRVGHRTGLLVAGLVAAAAVVLALSTPLAPSDVPASPVVAVDVDLTAPDDLDLRLDELQGEVAALSLDFATL